MLNFYMISSGSRGNSTIIWDESDLIVIDCGISLKRFMDKTSAFDLGPLEKSVFISHEHSDHSSGVKAVSRRLKMDVYSKRMTLDRMGMDSAYSIDGEIAIGNFSIIPVGISHDAVDPVAYIIKNRGLKVSVVSDLGIVDDALIKEMENSDIMAIEANHDREMLANGPYPEALKRRISSDHGHLSNEQSAEAIYSAAGKNTKIILTHLSEKNNMPDIALNTVKSYLLNRKKEFESIECASQDYGSTHYNIK
ncbi:MAG: MBL fold metallo-hydrolase [Ferroplasma sp.]